MRFSKRLAQLVHVVVGALPATAEVTDLLSPALTGCADQQHQPLPCILVNLVRSHLPQLSTFCIANLRPLPYVGPICLKRHSANRLQQRCMPGEWQAEGRGTSTEVGLRLVPKTTLPLLVDPLEISAVERILTPPRVL